MSAASVAAGTLVPEHTRRYREAMKHLRGECVNPLCPASRYCTRREAWLALAGALVKMPELNLYDAVALSNVSDDDEMAMQRQLETYPFASLRKIASASDARLFMVRHLAEMAT